jgi:TIR domain
VAGPREWLFAINEDLTTQLEPIPAGIQVFVSYAHKDEKLRSELDKHLTLLKRKGVVDAWYDRKILPGTDFGAEIDNRLCGSQLVLFLVSPDFLASGYCYEKEMARAMQMHQAGSARVIPVILRPVDWKDAPFAKLLALPKDGKPVTKWANRDSALLDITEGIRSAINGLAKEREMSRGIEALGMPVLRRFGGQVIHIGGVGSRVVTKIAYLLDEHGYLPANDYVTHYFNGPADIMWVNCPDGFRIASASSSTGNDVFPMVEGDEDTAYGILLLNQLQNTIEFRCEAK